MTSVMLVTGLSSSSELLMSLATSSSRRVSRWLFQVQCRSVRILDSIYKRYYYYNSYVDCYCHYCTMWVNMHRGFHLENIYSFLYELLLVINILYEDTLL